MGGLWGGLWGRVLFPDGDKDNNEDNELGGGKFLKYGWPKKTLCPEPAGALFMKCVASGVS